MLLIGLDVGTTGTKALLINNEGEILGKGYKSYRLYCEHTRIEQSVQDWWEACVCAIKEAISGYDHNEIEAICVSSQGASMVALDSKNRPIGNAITWMDTRAVSEADYINTHLTNEYVYKTTGWRTSPSNDAAKILYMKRNAYYSSAKIFVSTIEYINLKLTGNAVIDPTNAAIRQLYSVELNKWDNKILEIIGINEMQLPVVKKTGDIVGELEETAAKELGLRKSVKVFNGAHDQYCASIGSGAIKPGDVFVSTGTTWVVMGITEKPIFSDSYIASCKHPAGDLYGAMISLAGSGNSLQWVKDNFLADLSYEEIINKCVNRQEKNKKLIFVPWLAGAAYPYWNASFEGGFQGMNFSTHGYDMALSVMESAVFNTNNALKDLSNNGCRINEVKVMGGATKSDFWMDILQSVVSVPIYRMRETDTSALGASIIAATSLGWYKNYSEAVKAFVKYDIIKNENKMRGFYQQKYDYYCSCINNLKDFYLENQ